MDPLAKPDYIGRLAPSPTGDLHFGHLRSFLVAWVRARQARGLLRLRIEDLDPPRAVAGSAERIVEDLRWLGFDWDGPITYQSTRNAAYESALVRLETKGRAFLCSCSRKEIHAVASAPHGAEELGPRYPGTCRKGVQGSAPYAVRFLSNGERIHFVDGLFGPVEGSQWLDDFVLRRKDNLWAYQLAVVVDDAEAGVTEVVRGDDLLSSTARQLALYAALDLRPPNYVHLPLVVDRTGSRLSKRHHSTTIRELRALGWSVEDLLERSALSLGIRQPCRSLEEVLRLYRLEHVPRDPVTIDL